MPEGREQGIALSFTFCAFASAVRVYVPGLGVRGPFAVLLIRRFLV